MESYEDMKEKLDKQNKADSDNELKRILSESKEINKFKTYCYIPNIRIIF